MTTSVINPCPLSFARPRWSTARIGLLSLVLASLTLLSVGARAQLPANFVDENLISGLNQPISMRFLPDGRLLVLEKEGRVVLADPNQGWATATYMTITNIQATDERGLIDIAIDPNFATNPYVYLYYTRRTPRRARIARFTHQENSGGLTSRGGLSSEFVVWEENWSGDPYANCCHYGAGLDFGPDGKLYLTPGDKFDGANAQDRTSSAGSIIRINPDGTIPVDNPYVGNTNGWDESIWAYGLRNPFRARWDLTPGEERLFIGEVGGNDQSRSWEDLHLGEAGANYGWPYCEGPFGRPDLLDDFPDCDVDLYTGPVYAYDHLGPTPNGGSITGGVVYRGSAFPSQYYGAYFFGDYAATYIRYLTFDPSDPTVVTGDFDFQPNAGPIVALEQGPDGALYYIQISGFLRRIAYDGLSVTSTATPASGPSPLAVSFDGEATGGSGPLTYTWTFGDGTDSGPLSDPATTHTYTANGVYDAVLEVTDGTLTSFAIPISIQVGEPPSATILAPADGSLFRAGDTIFYSGEGSGGTGALELSWTVRFWHNAHYHPVLEDSVGVGGSFYIKTNEHSYADSTRYSIELTVTDALGLTDTDLVTVYPDKVDLTFETAPVPIPITYGEQTVVPPYSVDEIIGFQPTISVPASRCVNGTQYVFESWSDGGAREHMIVVPDMDQTYTATFTANGGCSGVPVTSGLALYLEADRGVTAAGGFVSAWADQSGQGNDLTAAGDPSIGVATTPSGQPAIAFDGVGDKLERTSALNGLPAGAADRTAFLVTEYSSNGWGGFAYGSNNCGQTFGLVVDNTGDLTVQRWCSDYTTNEPGNGAGWLVQSAVLSGATLTHYKDGAVIGTKTGASFNTVLTRLVLGAEIDSNPYLDMDVAAVLVYDRALSETERQQVETYLQDKYLAAPPAAQATITSPLDGEFVTGPDVTVTWTAFGPGSNDHVHLTLDGGSYIGGQPLNGSYTFTDLADGPHTLTAEVASMGHQVYAGSEDTVTFTVTSGPPLPGPGLVLRLETDYNVTTNGGNTVAGWLDQSGNGNDLSASGDPQLVAAATPSGQSAIVFDGVGDKLARAALLNNLPAGSDDRTMFTVIRYDAANADGGAAYGDGAPNQAFGLVVDGASGLLAVQGWGSGNDLVSTEPGIGAGWLIQSALVASDAVTHYKDGVQIDAATRAYDTDLQQIVLGAEIGGAGDGEEMAIAAVLLWDRALTETERQQAEAYLQQKYLDAPNAPPVAQDDGATVEQGATVIIDVLANDTDDVGLDPATVTVVDAPANGTVDAIDPGTGAITYTHDGSTTTSDTFTYTVDDGDGATSNVATVTITVTPLQVSIAETYDAGWGLVSLPATVPDPDYLAVFEGGAGGDPQSPVYVVPNTFYEFDGAYYTPDPPDLTLGVGAWLKFAQEAAVTIDGDYVGTLDRVIGSGGWYLFSGPSCALPVSVLESYVDIVDGTVYGFDGAYFTPTTLEPGHAYWAKVADGAAPTITLACGEAAQPPLLAAGTRAAGHSETAARGMGTRHATERGGARTGATVTAGAPRAQAVTQVPNLSAFGALTIADADGHARTLRFGATLPADADRERFSLPPVPPAGAFDARFDGDIGLTEEAETRVLVQAASSPVRIQADALPGGDYLLDVVVDGEVEATHTLTAGAAVEVSGPPAALQGGFALHLRPAASVELPASFALRGAYPNPLRREATVAFDLPEPADVRLEVYDVLGRRVAVVEEMAVEAGASRTLRLGAGGLASGAYVFRLVAVMASGTATESGRLTVVH